MKIKGSLLRLSLFLCAAVVVGAVMLAVRGSLPPLALPIVLVAGIVTLLLIFSVGQSGD
jgi:hypothetical protein